MDGRIEIPSKQWKAQSEDRKEILNPVGSSQLPRDPLLLALLSEQMNRRSFFSNVLEDERSLRWAPEIREILSVDIIKRCGELNRMRIYEGYDCVKD
jgi:cohesin complex subunit SCC1